MIIHDATRILSSQTSVKKHLEPASSQTFYINNQPRVAYIDINSVCDYSADRESLIGSPIFSFLLGRLVFLVVAEVQFFCVIHLHLGSWIPDKTGLTVRHNILSHRAHYHPECCPLMGHFQTAFFFFFFYTALLSPSVPNSSGHPCSASSLNNKTHRILFCLISQGCVG